MAKLKTIYICEKCGKEHSKWSGQCAGCGSWNTLIEDVISTGELKKTAAGITSLTPSLVDTAVDTSATKIETGIGELDRVLGGGIMPDGITLLSGDPGIGKSTLVLQVAAKVAAQGKKVFYFSGEESVEQITGRLMRLKLPAENIHIINTVMLEAVTATIDEYKPDFVILDSVQVVASIELPSAAGSMTQVRTVAEHMMRVAKEKGIPVMLIGHVNKDGNLAGPMTLSHLVDTVLYLEGDQYQQFRLLRGIKNRFGTTSEVGVFVMEEEGMKEVSNPSAAFLEGRQADAIGSAVAVTLEGTRPFLLEIQALTTHTAFGYPKRTASGIDQNRLHIMLAVLNKYAKMKMDSQDAYLNVVGGFKVKDPACDLAICMALASSKLKIALPQDAVMIGEVGLSGELRSVSQMERRVSDVAKLGFKRVFMPDAKIKAPKGVKVIPVRTVVEAVKELQA